MRVPVCMGRYIQTREALSSLGRKFDRSQAGGVYAAYIFTLRLTGSKLPVPGEPCRRVADVAHPTHRRGENDADVSKEVKDSIQPVWAPAMEVFGAMEAVDMWHAKYLRMYMEDIIESIPKGSIYFGGTDPGRFAITLGSNSHEKADPFFTITQNAFADGTYLQYLRELYGKRIYIPTDKDNQDAFTEYYQNAQKRMVSGRLNPRENVTFKYNFKCPQCDTPHLISINQSRLEIYKKITTQGGLRCPKDNTLMPSPAPQVHVRGNGSLLTIIALLSKKIWIPMFKY